MDCVHHWVIESPGEARERWNEQSLEGEGQTYQSRCKKCGAEKDHISDRKFDYLAEEVSKSNFFPEDMPEVHRRSRRRRLGRE